MAINAVVLLWCTRKWFKKDSTKYYKKAGLTREEPSRK